MNRYNGIIIINKGSRKPKGYTSQAAKQAAKDMREDKDMRVTVDYGYGWVKMNVILTEDFLEEW